MPLFSVASMENRAKLYLSRTTSHQENCSVKRTWARLSSQNLLYLPFFFLMQVLFLISKEEKSFFTKGNFFFFNLLWNFFFQIIVKDNISKFEKKEKIQKHLILEDFCFAILIDLFIKNGKLVLKNTTFFKIDFFYLFILWTRVQKIEKCNC